MQVLLSEFPGIKVGDVIEFRGQSCTVIEIHKADVRDEVGAASIIEYATIQTPDERQQQASVKALELLVSTDYRVIKQAEGRVALSQAWLDWRESLRKVVRGESYEVQSAPQ